jgi:hypothetical protein
MDPGLPAGGCSLQLDLLVKGRHLHPRALQMRCELTHRILLAVLVRVGWHRSRRLARDPLLSTM